MPRRCSTMKESKSNTDQSPSIKKGTGKQYILTCPNRFASRVPMPDRRNGQIISYFNRFLPSTIQLNLSNRLVIALTKHLTSVEFKLKKNREAKLTFLKKSKDIIVYAYEVVLKSPAEKTTAKQLVMPKKEMHQEATVAHPKFLGKSKDNVQQTSGKRQQDDIVDQPHSSKVAECQVNPAHANVRELRSCKSLQGTPDADNVSKLRDSESSRPVKRLRSSGGEEADHNMAIARKQEPRKKLNCDSGETQRIASNNKPLKSKLDSGLSKPEKQPDDQFHARDVEIEKLKADNKSLLDIQYAKTDEMASLVGVNDSLKLEIESMKQMQVFMNTKVKLKDKELENVKSAHSSDRSEVKSLKERLEALSAQTEKDSKLIKQLQSKVEKDERLIGRLQHQMEEYAKVIVRLEIQEEEAASLIRRLQDQAGNDGKLNENLQNQATKDAKVIGRLRDQLEEYAKMIVRFQDQEEKKASLIRRLQNQTEDDKKLTERLQNQAEKNAKLTDHLQNQAESDKTLIEHLQNQAEKDRKLIGRLQKQRMEMCRVFRGFGFHETSSYSITNKGSTIPESGKQKKQKKLREIQTNAAVALRFIESYGVNVKTLVLDAAGTPIFIPLDEAEASKQHVGGNADQSLLFDLLFVLDHNSISDASYRQLARVIPELPRLRLLHQARQEVLNGLPELLPTKTFPGAHWRFKELLCSYVTRMLQGSNSKDTVHLKLSGEISMLGKSSTSWITLYVTLWSDRKPSQTVVPLGTVEGPGSNYVVLKEAFANCWQDINEVIESGSIGLELPATSTTVQVPVKICLVADVTFLRCVLGLSDLKSFPCVLCNIPKDDMHWIPFSLEDACQRTWNSSTSSLPGDDLSPLLQLPRSDMSVCMQHMFLAVMAKLEACLFEDVIGHSTDEVDASVAKLSAIIRKCGIAFRAWRPAKRPTSTPAFEWTELTTDGKLKLLKNLPDRLTGSGLLDQEREEQVIRLWKDFEDLYCDILLFESGSQEQVFLKARQWLLDYKSMRNTAEDDDDELALCFHVLVVHVPNLCGKFSGLSKVSRQPTERLSDELKRLCQAKVNAWDAAKEALYVYQRKAEFSKRAKKVGKYGLNTRILQMPKVSEDELGAMTANELWFELLFKFGIKSPATTKAELLKLWKQRKRLNNVTGTR